MIRYLALTLALLIAITSQQMAVSPGMAYDVDGQVILCTGPGTVTVGMNSQGEPMGVVHFCPDCALTLLAVASTPARLEPLVIHSQTLAQSPFATAQITISPRAEIARGPPRTV